MPRRGSTTYLRSHGSCASAQTPSPLRSASLSTTTTLIVGAGSMRNSSSDSLARSLLSSCRRLNVAMQIVMATAFRIGALGIFRLRQSGVAMFGRGERVQEQGVRADDGGDAKRPFEGVLHQKRAFTHVVHQNEYEKGDGPHVPGRLIHLWIGQLALEPGTDDVKDE